MVLNIFSEINLVCLAFTNFFLRVNDLQKQSKGGAAQIWYAWLLPN